MDSLDTTVFFVYENNLFIAIVVIVFIYKRNMINFFSRLVNSKPVGFSLWFDKFERCQTDAGLKEDSVKIITVCFDEVALSYFEYLSLSIKFFHKDYENLLNA